MLWEEGPWATSTKLRDNLTKTMIEKVLLLRNQELACEWEGAIVIKGCLREAPLEYNSNLC